MAKRAYRSNYLDAPNTVVLDTRFKTPKVLISGVEDW
jgi:hypothetical protein